MTTIEIEDTQDLSVRPFLNEKVDMDFIDKRGSAVRVTVEREAFELLLERGREAISKT